MEKTNSISQLNPDQSLYTSLLQAAKKNPIAPALCYKGKDISFENVLAQVDLLAAALIKAGIKPNDIVASALPNIPKAVYFLYAVNKIGAIAYLNHALESATQMEKNMDFTGAKILFTHEANVVKYREFCQAKGIRLISICPADEMGAFIKWIYRTKEKLNKKVREGAEDYLSFLGDAMPHPKDFVEKNAIETSVLLNSGGTTGIPKTVEICSFAINQLAIVGPSIIGTSEVAYKYMLHPLPLFHCFGLMKGLHTMVMHGGCCVLIPRFTRKEFMRYIQKNKSHFLLGVPAVYDALLTMKKFKGKKLQTIQTAFMGGDVCKKETILAFDSKMEKIDNIARLNEGYGLTETLSVCCVNTNRIRKVGSVGKPIKGVLIRAFSTDRAKVFLDNWERPPHIPQDAEAGELCISGLILMRGYHKDEAASNTAFLEALGRKWLKSGDFGYIDKDGFVHFIQRLKHIIIVYGENVFPTEIETRANEVKGIIKSAAFAVEDKKATSRVYLAVEVKAGISENEKKVLHDTLMEHLRLGLQKYAVPIGIDFYEELPRTKMMKIDIEALRINAEKTTRSMQ